MDANVEATAIEAVDLTDLTTNLVSAYVSNNRVPVSDLPALIASMHLALTGLRNSNAGSAATAVEKPTPAQIRKSITPDALISFVDGNSYKTLKRHLSVNGMTIEEYRERFGLPRDYPSTATNYSAQRSAFAKSIGLGNDRRRTVAKSSEALPAVEKPKRAGRSQKSR